MDFPGKSLMIDQIHQAVSADSAEAITENLRAVLCELVDDERIKLPDCVLDYSDDHYCRRLLHEDKELGYTVLAMTWGPGQGTPLHDHAGMWCVEAVWHGEIEVVQYELVEREDNQFRLEPRTTMRSGVGSAGSLIPPHEHHTIANPSKTEPAVTIHIYSGVMDECCVFKPVGENWFDRKPTALSLDAD
jgi:predicted metal-dependent enzyme (double-stranded beta helix superfamily)